MAAGWSRLAEKETRAVAQRPLAARLRVSLAGGVAASLALGRRWAGAGRRVAERIWRSVTGQVEQSPTGAALSAQSKVVSLANPARHRRIAAVPHRPEEGARVVPIRPIARNEAGEAVPTTTTQEEKVEQIQGRDAADPVPVSVRNSKRDWDPHEHAVTPVADEAEDAFEAKESEPSDEDSPPEDASCDAAAEEIEGREDGEAESLHGERLDSIVESLLLAAGTPLTVRRMCDAIRSGPLAKDVRASLRRLADHYGGGRGIHLVEVDGAFQLRTAPANAKFVRALLREKPARLGRAALETLSIIAYKQPVTRGDIEAIRGVDADSAINTLLSQRLIKIDGRKEAVGRPLLYATTPEFLETFGLKDLKDLPTLKEIGPVPEPENEIMDIEDEDDTVIAAAASEEEVVETVAMSENGAQPDGEETPVEAPLALGRNDDEEDDGEEFDEDDEDAEADDDADEDDDAEEDEDFDDDLDEEDDGDDDEDEEDEDFDFDDDDDEDEDEDEEDAEDAGGDDY